MLLNVSSVNAANSQNHYSNMLCSRHAIRIQSTNFQRSDSRAKTVLKNLNPLSPTSCKLLKLRTSFFGVNHHKTTWRVSNSYQPTRIIPQALASIMQVVTSAKVIRIRHARCIATSLANLAGSIDARIPKRDQKCFD